MTRTVAREIAVHMVFELGFGDRSAQQLLEDELTAENFALIGAEEPLYAEFPDEKQEQYITPVNSIWCTALAIPVTAEDVERTGTILNVASAYSVDTVTTTLYELILGSKLIREETSLVMLDYVWANKQYCWGNGYEWATPMENLLYDLYEQDTFMLASQLQTQSERLQTALDKFLQQFDDLP